MNAEVVPDILLWVADLRRFSADALSIHSTWLGESEQHRYKKFVRSGRAHQFLLGRMLLRAMLSRMLDISPRDICVQEYHGAAPILKFSGCERIGFSISHSGPWVGCAVSLTSRIGLDIERIDSSRDIAALANQAFTNQQREWLALRPAVSRLRDFYMLWSKEEARYKLGTTIANSCEFFHPDIAIALCCEQEFRQAPVLELITLPFDREICKDLGS